MKKGQWFRADDITESDIAVIVDSNTDTIWFWEGQRSSARNRSKAREILGLLKKKYIPYRFKRVTRNSPLEVLTKLEELKELSFTGKISGIKYELKDFSRVLYILNIIGGILAIISMIYLWQALYWTETSEGLDYMHFSVDFTFFLSYINISSYILLAITLMYMFSAFFGGILKKKSFYLLSILAACAIFVAFFMVRIWDVILFYEEIDNDILIRKDALILFSFCLEVLLIPGMVLGMITGISGLRSINIIEETEELEEKEVIKK